MTSPSRKYRRCWVNEMCSVLPLEMVQSRENVRLWLSSEQMSSLIWNIISRIESSNQAQEYRYFSALLRFVHSRSALHFLWERWLNSSLPPTINHLYFSNSQESCSFSHKGIELIYGRLNGRAAYTHQSSLTDTLHSLSLSLKMWEMRKVKYSEV